VSALHRRAPITAPDAVGCAAVAGELSDVRRPAEQNTVSMRKTSRPPSQPPLELLNSIREKLWFYTVSLFRLDRNLPAHSGTATCLAAKGSFYLLTAGHVWKALQKSDFAVALEAERPLIPVEREVADTKMPSRSGASEWGPDLSLIRIPDQVAREIQKAKAFYNVGLVRPKPKAPPGCVKMSLWAVLGAPDEQSIKGQQETVHNLSLFETWTAQKRAKAGYDYYDLKFSRKRRPALPRSFRGISGSGLWEVPVLLRHARTEIKWSETVRLAGVAFYEMDGPAGTTFIRCHGPKSIRDHLLADVA